MRAWLVGMVVPLSGCFVASPVMRFGGGKTAKEVQHEGLGKATPPALVAVETWDGEVSNATIRVWADDDYRAQNVRWQRAFDEQLGYANEVLAPMLGVRLEAEYREWRYHPQPGSSLDESLAALTEQDPGNDVFAVVGLTSAVGLVSATFDQLGVASVGGRHLVVRGYADVEERKVFDRAFRDLTAEERELMYKLRRRHKTAAVLLHELGHSLGAPHENEPETIMNARYSDRSASFNTRSRELMLATVDERLHRAKPPALDAAEAHPSLVIHIDTSGASVVGGVAIADASLQEMLRLSFADDPETAVVIKAHPNAPRGALAAVLDRARAAGLRRVSTISDSDP